MTSTVGSAAASPVQQGWGRIEVHPGAGVVDHHGEALLVVPSVGADAGRWTRELVDICRGRHGGEEPLRAAGALLAGAASGEVPAFALLVRGEEALGILVHGAVPVFVDGVEVGGGGAHEAGTDVLRTVDGAQWQEVRVGRPAWDAAAINGPPFDLESGTVPGAGVTIHHESRKPLRDSGSTMLHEAVRFRTVRLAHTSRADPAGRAPLPVAAEPDGAGSAAREEVLVEGALCESGHFVDPDQTVCPTCGGALGAAPRVVRPRPPLGILVTDGGSIYTVTGDYVIGREPQRSPLVLSGQAQALVLRDADRSTSRVHAVLRVSGWKVSISDVRSANGTFVSSKGAAGPWDPVPVDPALRLFPGDRVRLGKRQLLFEGHREGPVGHTGL